MTLINLCLNVCTHINSQKIAQQTSIQIDKDENKLPAKEEAEKLNYYLKQARLDIPGFFDAPKPSQGIPGDECVKFLEDFISKYPEVSYIIYLKLALIHVYIRRGKFEKALKLCGDLPPQTDLLGRRIIEEIIVLYPELRGFEPAKVKEVYRKIADKFGQAIPEEFLPLIRAEVLAKLGDIRNKNASYEKYLSQLFPPDLSVSQQFIFNVYVNAFPAFLKIIGDYYFNSQQYKEALNVYIQILDMYPSLAQTNEIRLNTGKAYEKCGEQEKALAIYKKSLLKQKGIMPKRNYG